MRHLGLLSGSALILLSAVAPGRAVADETTFCKAYITTLPYTITQQGHYCFNRNLTAAFPISTAITIQSDFVVLDLNGFKLQYTGSVNDGTPKTGVYAENRKNLVIRNGTLVGCTHGVTLYEFTAGGSANHRLEDLQIMEGQMPVLVDGASNVVRRCVFRNIRFGLPASAGIAAIFLRGSGGLVSGNVIDGVPGNGIHQTYGIRAQGLRHVLEDNVVSAVTQSSGPGGIGLFMDDASSIYRDNTVLATAVPYSGGTPVGDNHP
jgi:hypothetical protein